MANPPPQDDDPLPDQPSPKKDPVQLAKKLRTKIDKLKLQFPPLPAFQGTADQLDDLGQAAGDATIDSDQIVALDLAQKLFLLEKASLKPSLTAAVAIDAPASGEMPALVLAAGTLTPSNQAGVHFDKVEFRSPPGEAEYSAGTSYSKFESSLQRQCVTETTATVGMPGIFKVDASYNSTASRSMHEQKIEIFVHASRMVRKAEIIFVRDKLSLEPEMIAKLEQACAPGKTAKTVGGLLDLLDEYGHFVPTSIFMGGRVTLSTSKELSDHSEFNSVSHEIRIAAKARLESGRGGGSTGGGTTQQATTSTAYQASELQAEVRGGDPSRANSQIRNFGTA